MDPFLEERRWKQQLLTEEHDRQNEQSEKKREWLDEQAKKAWFRTLITIVVAYVMTFVAIVILLKI